MYSKAGGLHGPRYGFGTDDRFNRLGRQLSDASELPGPGSYSGNSTFGSQRSSRLTSQPMFGFGSSTRDHSARLFVSDMHAKSGAAVTAKGPGPGVYSLNSSIGTQVRPSRDLAHAPPPRASRTHPNPKRHPHPCCHPCCAQATSRGHSAPSWGFGKASRFDGRAYTTDTPGPGSYAT